MATYEIEAPDGAVYEIEAADDAQLQATVAQLTGSAAPSAPAAPQSSSLLDQFKRAAGLTGRSIMQGASDLAYLPADILTSLDNLAHPEGYDVTLDDGSKAHRGPAPLPSQDRDALLSMTGLPEPATPGERILNLAGRGATGAMGVAKTASTLPGEIAKAMAQRPLLQTISGATGGGSAGTAREAGFGPGGQMLAALVGGMAPALMSPRAPLPSMSMPTLAEAEANAAAGARVGQGQAAAESVLNATPEARATGGGYTFGHVGADESAGLTPTMQRVADRGRQIGMRLTPGQATGSRALQQMEAKLEGQPMTSGPFNTLKANNARALNRAAAEAIGESGTVVDDVTLGRAADRIGQVFNEIGDSTARAIEPRGFVQFLGGLQDETRGIVSSLTSHPLVEDVIALATQGAASGKQLASLSSKLGKAAYKNMSTQSGDRDLGIALYRVKDYVDDLLGQGLSPQRAETFGQARQQYRNLMLLTQRTGVVNPASGDVNGRALATLLQGKDKRGYTYGNNRSPMYDAARFAQAYGPIVGDSGTATRVPLQGLTDLLTRVPANLATRAYTSSPVVNMFLRAQAASRAAGTGVRSMGGPLSTSDLPVSGIAGSVLNSRGEPPTAAEILEALARQGVATGPLLGPSPKGPHAGRWHGG
jgi:hypothetical protein